MPIIGKDLAKIRSHQGYTLNDIQQATKIPVTTLQSIEDNSIFADSGESKTYIRSFVRSYGKALKISDDLMIKALDQQETGNYNHLLLQNFSELAAEDQPSEDDQLPEQAPEEGRTAVADKKADSGSESQSELELEPKPDSGSSREKPYDNADTEKITPDVNKQETRESQAVESKKSEPAATLKTVPAKKDDSYERNVNWADVGRKFSNEKKHTSTWIVGLVILIVIAAVAGYILYQNGFFDFAGQLEGDASTSVTQTTQGGLSLDLEETIPENATLQTVEPAAELSNVLYLTVYAAYDKLDPVRIWSDLKPRMDPYWIEQGVALNFEFQDTIRLRGQYENTILFKNGHRVNYNFDDFYNADSDYVELTRGFFTTDPKWASSISFELPEDVSPPDSVADRPSF
jgi:hypothetical protein